ncbi:MAG: DAK2 domain-containing protein [Oscillibacter sp.]|nr:DAK2 domain-containing protein [Oscillibacter sp.]
MKELITGALFKEMILHAAAAISARTQEINDLNVFPVPDGDTGTNMSMTIAAAVGELNGKTVSRLDEAASLTASALLRGARGNSGVILSLLFRGMSRGLKGQESADSAVFAAAMQEGVSAAYKAVMKPAEGTILTVSRLTAKTAVDLAAEDAEISPEAMLSDALKTGYEALAQTTDMNPVLKKAGVVDAGGKGYLLILEGMLAALRGEPLPETGAQSTQKSADFAALTDEDITFTFDTVFIVRKKPGTPIEPFRAYLSSIGDSLVIGEDDEAFKVHVHTDTPGLALHEARKYGTLELAKIENMRLQYEDMSEGRKPRSTDDLDAVEAELESMEYGTPKQDDAPPKKYGFLAVCAGDGLADIFRDLGADAIVSGGQTMNPSTESISAAVERINAETVFILPNNGNIILAAQQCTRLTEKNIVVIPTKTIPQGITALMNVNFDAESVEEITEAMSGCLGSVRTAQITYAARDSEYDGFDIHAGDYLALDEGKLFGTDHSIDSLMERIADAGAKLDASFISLYYGEDVKEEDAQKAAKVFEAACPDAEIAVLSGGQPVYYYIISIE